MMTMHEIVASASDSCPDCGARGWLLHYQESPDEPPIGVQRWCLNCHLVSQVWGVF